jgi:hypothetical protein
MEPALGAQFPLIRTYTARGVTNPYELAHLDLTPAGFHAQVLSPDGAWYIDPVTRADNSNLASYRKRDLHVRGGFHCLTHPSERDMAVADPGPAFTPRTNGTQIRTYQLAITATGEYTAFHGGTVPAALGAIVTSVNRVSGIYEVDLAVRLQLVANTTLTIYTNAATDPYPSPGPGTATLDTAQTQFDTLIGSANYDVGHIYHRAANSGVAGAIGNVCVAGGKGRGFSQTEPPVGDPFSVDYVAHELGHQFGGRHSFNNCGGGPGDSAAIAHEPASGSTIMGYAGICGSNDLQPNSDPMFASINFDQMIAYTQSGAGASCADITPSGTTPPVVTGGADFTIPISTPFLLTANGSDADLDPLTYSWEQRNGGAAVPLTSFIDNGTSPIARVYNPTTSPSRSIPRMSNVFANTLPLGEALPATSRVMLWRVTARDARGGTDWDDVNITSTTSAGPFIVTLPTGPTTWTAGAAHEVRWSVAGTNAAPVNASNVDIFFTRDSGATLETLLLGTPNDGSQFVTAPTGSTTSGRIVVRASSNIFYNVSQGGSITIFDPLPGVDLRAGSAATFTDNTGNGNSNARIDPGESEIRVFVPARNLGLTTATNAVGTLVSLTPTAIITGNVASYPDIVSLGADSTNTSPFTLSVLPAHPCGDPISLRLDLACDQGSGSFAFTFNSGQPGGPGPLVRTQYAGPAVNIPAGNAAGVLVNLPRSGFSRPIADVNVSVDTVGGAACSDASAGISHTWIGDLILSVRSPAGTFVSLINQRNNPNDNTNNLCNTVFDDSAFQPISAGTGGPFTGTWRPETPLSALNGQSANGTWALRAEDIITADTGQVRAFSIYVSELLPPVCQPPLPGPSCDSIDFNADGLFPDTLDIDDFLSVFSGGPCSNDPRCGDIDFNNDGLFPDTLDVDSLISVFSGGACL